MSLQSEMIKMKQEMEKYGIKNTYQILQLFKRNQDDILGKISKIYLKNMVGDALNISDYQRYTILTEIEKLLKGSIDVLTDKHTSITRDILTDVYQETYYQSAFLIDKGVKATTNFALLRPEMVKAAIERPIRGRDFSTSIWKDTNKLSKRVISDVEKALIQGASPEKLARDIKSTYGSSAYEAKRLINTEVAKSVMFAQDEVYQESGVVSQVLWDATLEENTCEDCADLDGQYFDKHDHPDVPFHPNCRCCIIPIVEGWKPTKKIENVRNADGTKSIIDYTDVNSWKKSKLE
jgi:SPP1 gp7 family putative phage head morphogenesis protein